LRDVSLLVPDPVPIADLLAALRETGPPLREAELADVYRDPRTSRRAVTVRLTLGSDLRTLERQEVARAVDGVMAAARRTGARPR
jgi:phenylalanyl-tRNA synthetase beta subunit